MSTILTETSTFSATVTAPDAGDSITGASVTTGLQSLTNRTKYLKDNADAFVADVSGTPTLASGSWVPTVTATEGMTGSATDETGHYLKIGDTVHFSVFFYMSEDGTNSGGDNGRAVSISLPVTRANFAASTEAIGTVTGQSIADVASTGGRLRATVGSQLMQARVYNTSAVSADIYWSVTGSYTLA